MLIWLLESSSTSSEGASSRPMTCDEFSVFRKAKEHERQGHFKNAGSRKKKKAAVSVSDNLYCLLLYHITFNYERLVNMYGATFADMGISRMVTSGISEKTAIISAVLKHLILYR